MKFPHNQEKQIAIAQATNGYWAKKVAYRKDGVSPYSKWDDHRIDAMRVSLAFKLAQHPKLASVILATDTLDIVEKSKRDAFWGAQPVSATYNVRVLDRDRIELSSEFAATVNAVMNIVRKFEHKGFDINPDFVEQVLTMNPHSAVPNIIEVTGPEQSYLAITKSDDGYQGANVLGKLWMNLRAHINGSVHNTPWMSALEFASGSFRNEFMINRTALSPSMLMPANSLNQRG